MMPFPTKEWKDEPSRTTPVDAAGLQDLEARIGAWAEAKATEAQNEAVSTFQAHGNIHVGEAALAAATSCEHMVAIGGEALASVTTGGAGVNGTVAVGYHALRHLTTGMYNTAAGYEALASATSAIGNTAFGYRSLVALTETPVGEYEKGRYNAAFGAEAMAAATICSYNAGIAPQALRRLTTGLQNVALGFNAMPMLTTGSYNVGLGTEALASIKTTSHNTALGTNAAIYATGSNNTVIGSGAMYGVGHEAGEEFVGESSGNYNTAVGAGAMVRFTTAAQNCAWGENAMEHLTSGAVNVSGGNGALARITSGSANVATGYKAGAKATGGSSENVFVGYEAGPSAEGEVSHKLYIHNGATAQPLIYGDFAARELIFYTERLAFYGAASVTQPSETTGKLGFVEGTGATVKSESTWTGEIGTKKYSVGGIVRVLKELGLIAQ